MTRIAPMIEAHHIHTAGLKRHERNDEFRSVAERGIEQAPGPFTDVHAELLGGLYNPRRKRHDGERRAKEDHRRGHIAEMLKNDRQGEKEQ